MGRSLLLTAFISLAHAAWACPSFVRAPTARADECARVEIKGPSDALSGESLTFSVAERPRKLGNVFTYNWTVSAGTIVSGQGTPAIVIDTTGIGGATLEVRLDIGGLPGACTRVASCNVFGPIGCRGPLDQYGNIRFDDEKARLDNFAVELQNDPASQGYVIAYGGRVGREGEAQRRAERATDYLSKARGVEASRIVTVDGGFREDLTVELWVVPAGAVPPAAIPTIDPSEVRIIREKPKSARGAAARGGKGN